MENTQISFPVIIMKEGKWFVASCPTLDIGTQGETEQEAKENMKDLICLKQELKSWEAAGIEDLNNIIE